MKKMISQILIIIFIVGSLFTNNSIVYGETTYPKAPEIYGGSAILMEAETGAILYEKNSHERLFPASITKIMTGLLAIENLSMDDTVTYTSEMLSDLPDSGIPAS